MATAKRAPMVVASDPEADHVSCSPTALQQRRNRVLDRLERELPLEMRAHNTTTQTEAAITDRRGAWR